MRAHAAKTITPGATRVAGAAACADSSQSGVVEPRWESNTAVLDDFSVSVLISFFEVLDRWDREPRGNAKTM